MAKNLMVCSSSSKTLKKINESVNGGRYILQGTFAELDKLNRNKRIYPKDEYLKHLQYLREDIKKGEPLLGELDHPDDRFEVKLKDASHRIIDLWYDSATNTVQGKIELLNTPNGLLAQSLVDMGVPLHISSRAAGTVNSDNTVSIQQIYTYDLVCKPGFASAVLHRVNESESSKYTNEMYNFFNKSEKYESKNSANKFGFVNEAVSIIEVPYGFNLRKEAKKIQENNDMNNMIDKNKLGKIYEDDDEEKKVDDADTENTENEEGNEEGVKILSVRAETSDGDGEGVKILGVKAETNSDEDDSDKEEGSEDKSDEENSDEENEAKKDDASECDGNCDKKDKEDASECDGNCNKDDKSEAKKDDKEKEMLCDCDKINKKKEAFEDKFADLVKNIKKKNECKQSNESMTLSKYPMSSMLNESNFVEFMGLNESQKSKVIGYLRENNICTPMGVNENWKKGIDYTPEKEVWLKYAPSNYKKLFESAPKNVQTSIRNTASYLIFENQRDVNVFWENTGLMESSAQKLVNEKYISNMPKIVVESKSDDLPYSKDFINMITEMASEYNE